MQLHRVHLIIGASCALFGALLTLLFMRLNPPQLSVPLPAPPPRNPTSVGAAVVDTPRVCQNIYRAVCQKKGITRDPTGSVRPDIEGEVQVLRLQEDVMRTHPDWNSSQVDEELIRLVYTPKRRARVQSAFDTVRQAIERFINSQPVTVFSAAQKTRIIERVNRTHLELPPPLDLYADSPDLLTKNDAFYERLDDGSTRLRIGGAYLYTSKSWFNLIFTLAHELGHSIDPCELKAAGIAISSIDRLSSCFVRQGLVAMRATRQECGAGDQLSETFADWLAVQVTSEALQNFSIEFRGPQLLSAVTNSVRDLCEQEDDGLSQPDIELHPSPHVRIDRIFGRHPVVRRLLGCGPVDQGSEYCRLGTQEITVTHGGLLGSPHLVMKSE